MGLPNPSGLNASYQIKDLVRIIRSSRPPWTRNAEVAIERWVNCFTTETQRGARGLGRAEAINPEDLPLFCLRSIVFL